jgi:hypothetical protein
MSIPGYAFDADVDIELIGTELHVLVEVLNQTIEDSVSDVGALFGEAPAEEPAP